MTWEHRRQENYMMDLQKCRCITERVLPSCVVEGHRSFTCGCPKAGVCWPKAGVCPNGDAAGWEAWPKPVWCSRDVAKAVLATSCLAGF